MVKKALYLNFHYPGLDIRPVRNYFGGGGTYDVIWYHNYPEDHIAVLEEDTQLKLKMTQGLVQSLLCWSMSRTKMLAKITKYIRFQLLGP